MLRCSGGAQSYIKNTLEQRSNRKEHNSSCFVRFVFFVVKNFCRAILRLRILLRILLDVPPGLAKLAAMRSQAKILCAIGIFGLMLFGIQSPMSAAAAKFGGLKPPPHGLCGTKGFKDVPPGWEAMVNCVTVPVNWADLEPTEGDYQPAFKQIDEILATAQARKLEVNLRIFCGHKSPAWLERKVGTLHFRDPVDQKESAPICFWKAEALAAGRRLHLALAQRYDHDARLLSVGISHCMTFWDEPFMRHPEAKENRDEFAKAGYTPGLDQAAQIQALRFHAEAWQHTYSFICLNPFEEIDAASPKGWKQNLDFTFAFMDQAIEILGPRIIFMNASIRYPLEKLGPAYLRLYERMSACGSLIGFQTAWWPRIGDCPKTLQQCVAYGAAFVEVQSGFQDPQKSHLTKPEFAVLDDQLEALAKKRFQLLRQKYGF